MAQLGSVGGIAVKAFTVSGKKNECSMASARSNCVCASGDHEFLRCTRPSFSGSPVRLAGSASAHTDATRVYVAPRAVRKPLNPFTTSFRCVVRRARRGGGGLELLCPFLLGAGRGVD